MNMPGFTAESSLIKTNLRMTSRLNSVVANSGVMPALPLGGWACIALGAACRRGSRFACAALASCNTPYGGENFPECYVNDDGSVTCDDNTL